MSTLEQSPVKSGDAAAASTILIVNGKTVKNDVQWIADEAELPASGRISVSLTRWTKEQAALEANAALDVGVRIANTVDLNTAWPQLASRQRIELEFPAFGDGRAYSQARLLRERYSFRGEIRALGAAVVLDQARELLRCGVNAFALRDDQKTEGFLEQLTKADSTPWYQTPIGAARPGFLRRAG
ncbi:MAG: DUF934 domain-containing protein [Pseudomonadota bacterium]|nr:DUF934 domain-containing protein [Pseudomonadota bacterium]